MRCNRRKFFGFIGKGLAVGAAAIAGFPANKLAGKEAKVIIDGAAGGRIDVTGPGNNATGGLAVGVGKPLPDCWDRRPWIDLTDWEEVTFRFNYGEPDDTI